MFSKKQFQMIVICVMAMGMTFAGCSLHDSDVGSVHGRVTLDGKPLAGAKVRFYPVSGRGSVGTTDDQGEFELLYIRNQNGAVVGKHRVTISTKKLPEVDENRVPINKGQPETLPPEYHDRKKTTLETTIEPGLNEPLFELTSKPVRKR